MLLFSVDGKCGYPLKDALKKNYTGLDGKDDKMFPECKSSVSLRLEVGPSAPTRSNGDPEFFCSGSHTRSGQDKSVPILTFHRVGIDDFYRFER